MWNYFQSSADDATEADQALNSDGAERTDVEAAAASAESEGFRSPIEESEVVFILPVFIVCWECFFCNFF